MSWPPRCSTLAASAAVSIAKRQSPTQYQMSATLCGCGHTSDLPMNHVSPRPRKSVNSSTRHFRTSKTLLNSPVPDHQFLRLIQSALANDCRRACSGIESCVVRAASPTSTALPSAAPPAAGQHSHAGSSQHPKIRPQVSAATSAVRQWPIRAADASSGAAQSACSQSSARTPRRHVRSVAAIHASTQRSPRADQGMLDTVNIRVLPSTATTMHHRN